MVYKCFYFIYKFDLKCICKFTVQKAKKREKEKMHFFCWREILEQWQHTFNNV